MSSQGELGGETVAVIPARGGSKGIPRKNLRNVGGLPLVVRAIDAAQAARLVDQVLVSTDDAEIRDVCANHGATVIQRPIDISGDTASSESALIHAVDAYEASTGRTVDVVVLLQCTSPFVISDDIDGVIRLVKEGLADSAFAATPFHGFLWRTGDKGETQGINHKRGPRQRRQELEVQFLEAGSVYAMNFKVLRAEGHRFCGRSRIHEIPVGRAHEIDTWDDLREAQALSEIRDREFGRNSLPQAIGAIAFDFDGVLTDNTAIVDEQGKESVLVSRSDGFGLELLRKTGIPMIVISKERNPVVTSRCEKLRLPVMQGIDDKLPALRNWLREQQVDAENALYVGNDVNDLPCLNYVGCAIGPADAHPSILSSLDLRLRTKGGKGALRELADLILSNEC